MPKAPFMYWQKRFDSENSDKELERFLKSGNYIKTMVTAIFLENFGTKTLFLTRKKFKELCKN